MRRLRDTPWTVWTWIGLGLVEAGIIAVPGDPTFGPDWAVWLAVEAVVVIGIVRGNHTAWVAAAVLSVFSLAWLLLFPLWPLFRFEAILIAIGAAEVAALFHPRTRNWTAKPPDAPFLGARRRRPDRRGFGLPG